MRGVIRLGYRGGGGGGSGDSVTPRSKSRWTPDGQANHNIMPAAYTGGTFAVKGRSPAPD